MEEASLLELIERSKKLGRWPLNEGLAVQLCRGVLASLSDAHREAPPRLHRDVGPHHVRVTPDGRATLDGFGASRSSGAHMSPEQTRGRPLDARSDLYSAAAMLFELACGRPPAASVTALALGELDAPRAVNPHLSEALAKVLERALDIEPLKRFVSAEALLAALDQAVPPGATLEVVEWLGALPRPEAEPLPAPPAGPTTPAMAPVPQRARPLRVLAALALVLVPIGATLVGLNLLEERQSEQRAAYEASLRDCEVLSEPAGAALYIDGVQYAERVPTVVRLEPGRQYTLEIRHPAGVMMRQVRDQRRLSVRLYDLKVLANEVYGAPSRGPEPAPTEPAEKATAGEAPHGEPRSTEDQNWELNEKLDKQADYDVEGAPVSFVLGPEHQLLLPDSVCFETQTGVGEVIAAPRLEQLLEPMGRSTRTQKTQRAFVPSFGAAAEPLITPALLAFFAGHGKPTLEVASGTLDHREAGTLCLFALTDRANDVARGDARFKTANDEHRVAAALIYVQSTDAFLVRSLATAPAWNVTLKLGDGPPPVMVLHTPGYVPRPVVMTEGVTRISGRSVWFTVPVRKPSDARHSISIQRAR